MISPIAKIFYRGVKLTTSNESLRSSLRAISECKKFQKYIDDIDHSRIAIDEFIVTDLDLFARPGSDATPTNIGFIKGKPMYMNDAPLDKATNKKIPSNIVFLRGGSVGVLIVIEIEGTDEKYFALIQQVRIPAGCYISEICAGMIDSATNNVVGVALKELEEETGIVINRSDLTELGSIWPSPGACDEEITLFYSYVTMSYSTFLEKQDRIFGESEDEVIKLKFVKADGRRETLEYLLSLKDAKLNSAYLMAIAKGLII